MSVPVVVQQLSLVANYHYHQNTNFLLCNCDRRDRKGGREGRGGEGGGKGRRERGEKEETFSVAYAAAYTVGSLDTF